MREVWVCATFARSSMADEGKAIRQHLPPLQGESSFEPWQLLSKPNFFCSHRLPGMRERARQRVRSPQFHWTLWSRVRSRWSRRTGQRRGCSTRTSSPTPRWRLPTSCTGSGMTPIKREGKKKTGNIWDDQTLLSWCFSSSKIVIVIAFEDIIQE